MATATAPANGQSPRTLLPWLNLMATEPFYILHIAAFSSYFAARASASPDVSHRLLQREIQAILAFSVLAVVKMVKEETWEAFIADTFLYAKGFLFVLALVIDHHVAICYLVSFLVIFVLTQQPPYDGAGDASQMTPLQLETVLTEGTISRFWLVEFRSLCSPSCVRTSRILPDLSTIYSNKSISFGIVDLGHFPGVAEKIGIQLGQLPTYILFDNAVEVARFPYFYSEAKGSIPTISKGILCRHFDLDRRLIKYVSGK
ncbi:putative Thioredoxin-like superfamily [Dioscorea sansibarensis]